MTTTEREEAHKKGKWQRQQGDDLNIFKLSKINKPNKLTKKNGQIYNRK